MKRLVSFLVLLLIVTVAAPILRADVKTVQRSTFKLEGLAGAILNRAAGGDAGLTTTMAIKGNRMRRMNDSTGDIVDLGEEKVYQLDVKKKTYTVRTFAEMRAEIEKERADAAKRESQVNPNEKPDSQAPEYEFEVDTKRTGEKQQVAGYNTEKVIMTITMHQKGRKLEDGGGMVMTNTMWVAPRVTALEEALDFNMKYFNAVYGSAFSGVDMSQMAALSAMMAGSSNLFGRMATEARKLQGTPLSSTMVIENVKSAEQMANAPKSSGGGLGGMLATRMMRGQSQQRTTTLTTTFQTRSIATTASADDVAIPAGFKEKKK